MRKFFILCLMAFVMCVNANAQLSVKSSTTKDDMISKDMYCSVRHIPNEGYFLTTTDVAQNTHSTLSLFLGKDNASAKLTLNDLYDWFTTAENKSSLVVTDTKSNEELTLYRVIKKTYIITNGDAEYARKVYNKLIMNQTIGTPKSKSNGSSPIMGYITEKVLKEALSIL